MKSEVECKAIIEEHIHEALDCLRMNVGDDNFELTPVELTEELKDVAHEPSISPDISVVYNLVSLANALGISVNEKYKSYALLFANELF